MSDEIDTYMTGEIPEVGDLIMAQTGREKLHIGMTYTVLHVENESRVVVQVGDKRLLRWADRFWLISRKLRHEVAVK